MLARAGPIPHGRGWTFEPKLDGFRCLICTHDGFRARSRRGWNMTPLLQEFARALPPRLQLDGEVVALADGCPDFHLLCRRMLHGRGGIDVVYFVFDVLAVEGLVTTVQPYAERRELLEALELEGPYVRLVATFEDGDALFRAVCDRGLEGIVAKRDRDPYRPGEYGWVKTKNRATARFIEERDRVGHRAARGGARVRAASP
jgi:bifunctional non-homologous end joining protein LigD